MGTLDLVDGTKTSTSTVHDDVPVGQTHQVFLLHRADTIARWSDVAHSEAAITDAELRVGHAEVGAAGAVVAVLVGAVEEVGQVLHITVLLLDSLNECLGGDVLTMLIGTQSMTFGWKLLTATREEHVVGRLSRQAWRERWIRLLGSALGRQIGVGDLGDGVLLTQEFGVTGQRGSSDVLGVDELLLGLVVDLSDDTVAAGRHLFRWLLWGSLGGGWSWLFMINRLIFFQFMGAFLGDIIDTTRHTFI